MINFEKIPKKSGVYIFKDENQGLLYIGKAQNLQKRIKSHFQKGESLFLVQGLDKVKDIDWILADSTNDALILEQQLIKKYQPKFNIRWKDDKNYFFAAITKEKFPRVFWSHQQVHPVTPRSFCLQAGEERKVFEKATVEETPVFKQGSNGVPKNAEYFGIFVSGKELKNYLFSLRKIFPFRSCKKIPQKPCFWYFLGLCFGVCQKEKHNKLKKQYLTLINGLKEMLKIYLGESGRIECYDISNIGQKFGVGSMIVFEKNKIKPSEFRKFKIKTVKTISDIACLKEIINRRMNHPEWKFPDLIMLDGGKAQLKAARELITPSIALAKTNKKKSVGKIYTHFSSKGLDLDELPQEVKNFLLQVRDKAHCFAIKYHKKTRKKHLIKL